MQKILIILLCGALLTGCATTSDSKSFTQAQYNVQLGLAYLQHKDYDRAWRTLTLAQQQAPHSAVPLDAMAYYQEVRGNTAQALAYYRQAAKVDPDNPSAHNNYGVFLCRNHDYERAEAEFKLALAQPHYPARGECYENAGLCARAHQHASLAADYLQQAVKLQPSKTILWYDLAEAYYQAGQYQAAKSALAHYHAQATANAASLLLAGSIAQRLHEVQAANQFARQLQAQFPNSSEAQQVKLIISHH